MTLKLERLWRNLLFLVVTTSVNLIWIKYHFSVRLNNMVSVECNIQSSSEECHSNGFFAKKEKERERERERDRERQRELLKVQGKIAKILSRTVYPN